jgi:SAM-dependent methyltransferase
MPPLKLNLGCGHIQPPRWVNVDGSNRAWLASKLHPVDSMLVRLRLLPPSEFNPRTVYANLLKPFPWPAGSASAIFMGDVLEHFSPEHGKHLVEESFRILAPGGVIRLRTPDHAHFWRNYVTEHDAMLASPREQWSLDHTRWTKMYFNDICTSRPRLWQSMGHFHKWGYDEVSLIKLLSSAGFADVRRMPFHESKIADIAVVELREDLSVEGTKPPDPV